MKRRAPALLFVLLLSPALALAANPVVRVATPLGSFDIELCAEVSEVCLGAAPNSVANFLGFVDRGDYDGSLIHRSIPGFVIQGGGFRREEGPVIRAVPADPDEAVENEFNQSNVRGTVAIPLVGNGASPCDTDENSGTSGWFVNIDDTNSSLDCGLFTVFGVVVRDDMEVVDAISDLPVAEFFDPITRTAPVFLFDLFDPTVIITAFQSVPFPQDFFDRITDPNAPPPPLSEVADAFISTDITLVPEPAAGLGGATALMALAALAQRLRPA